MTNYNLKIQQVCRKVMFSICFIALSSFSTQAVANNSGVAEQANKILPSVVSIIIAKDEAKTPSFVKEELTEERVLPYLQNSLIGKIPDKYIENIESLGSGFIVDKNGEILTNAHVIEGAQKIFVMLSDGTSYEAQLLGADTKTDIALIKIGVEKNLSPVTFGESAGLKVGEQVIAVGNPYGLGNTVSSGIVSALARDIFVGPYDEFIQTDVAVNKGSSGGPLFNSKAELVGVNTAIFSKTGGNSGISFAVPSDIAYKVYQSLKEFGRVKRGKIGVVVQPLTAENAKSLGLSSARGALVTSVESEGAAARIGIQPGDVILKFGGKDVYNMRQFPKMVASTPVGDIVDMVIFCEGKEIPTKVKIEELVEYNMAEMKEIVSFAETIEDVEADDLETFEVFEDSKKLEEKAKATTEDKEKTDAATVNSVKDEAKDVKTDDKKVEAESETEAEAKTKEDIKKEAGKIVELDDANETAKDNAK